MTLQQEQPSCSNKKNLWKPEEDLILKKYVETHGEGNWETVSKRSGLNRGGKSCRLRWKNYLRPNIKRGDMSQEEQDLIIRMHKLLGNRWSLIAGRLPGRTDNEVKNYWNTHLNKNINAISGSPAPEARGQGGRKRKTIDHEHHQDNCQYGHKNSKVISTGATQITQIGNNVSGEKPNRIGRKESDSVMSAVTATNHPFLMCDSTHSSSTHESLNFDYVDIDPPGSSWIQNYLSTTADNNARSLSSSAFVFDDEPFVAYMDSFLLLEAAFGCNSAASAERECNHQ